MSPATTPRDTPQPPATSADVDAYFAGLPEDARRALERMRTIILAAAPEASARIAYRVPVFKYRGHDLVGLAAFPDHCSLLLMSTGIIEAHAEALARYDTAKGTVRFPAAKPLPATLVTRLVKARIAENEQRWPARPVRPARPPRATAAATPAPPRASRTRASAG